MKRIIYLGTVLLLTALIGFACKSDECPPEACFNGTCIDGECFCAPGWAGDVCDRTCESLLPANYSVSQTCDNSEASYLCSIYPDTSDSSRYYFTNLYSFTESDSFYCTFDSCRLNISAQGNNSTQLSGTGRWVGKDIRIDLNVVENGVQTISCELELNRL